MYKANIMIVDDEPDILEVFTLFLGNDCNIFTERNALYAMEKFILVKPDILITDVNMPGMSGIDLLEKVKEISPSTEVIVMSGNMEEFLNARLSGAFDCMLKPVTVDELRNTVNKAIKKINNAEYNVCI